MARIARISKKGFIWFQRPFNPNYKIKLTRDNGTVDTITSTGDILFCSCNNPLIQQGIGRFTIILDNNAQTHTDRYTKNNAVEIYMDYGTATTVQFKGKVETSKKTFGDNGDILELKGFHVSRTLLDILVTANYEDTEISTILNDIIDDFLGTNATKDYGFTHTNVNVTSINATINWSEKPFLDCVIDLCDLAGFDCYVDDDKDFHFFKKNSINQNKDAVVQSDKRGNLIENKGLSDDITSVKNKVIVIGETRDGSKIRYPATDSQSDTDYDTRVKVISNSDIKTYSDAKDRAEAELALLKDSQTIGNTKSLFLKNTLPGELLMIRIPLQNIEKRYKVVNIVRTVDINSPHFFTSEVELSEVGKSIPHFFKERRKKELELQNIDNKNQMDEYYSFDFNNEDDTISHTNTELSNGFLKLQDGKSQGTWISKVKTLATDVHASEIRLVGQDYDSSEFYVGVNDQWDIITPGQNNPINTTNTGKEVKIKVILKKDDNNTTPQIDSLELRVKGSVL